MKTGDRFREMAVKLNNRADIIEKEGLGLKDDSTIRTHGLRMKAIDLLIEAEKADQVDTLIEVLVGIRGSVSAF